MPNSYDVGDVIRLSSNFQQGGADIDPTTVAVTIRNAAGTKVTFTYLTDFEVVKDSVGDYHTDYTPTVSGRHWYRWVSTGTGAAGAEEAFDVRPLQVNR